jgi:hypothetical protein
MAAAAHQTCSGPTAAMLLPPCSDCLARWTYDTCQKFPVECMAQLISTNEGHIRAGHAHMRPGTLLNRLAHVQ